MNIGSFSGRLILKTASDINYVATQTVKLTVEQNGILLAQQDISEISVIGKNFDISYNYISFKDPFSLTLEMNGTDEQFNKDNSVELTDFIIDQLFSVPKMQYKGTILDLTNNTIYTGNTLWGNNKLIYTFRLPILNEIVNFKI